MPVKPNLDVFQSSGNTSSDSLVLDKKATLDTSNVTVYRLNDDTVQAVYGNESDIYCRALISYVREEEETPKPKQYTGYVKKAELDAMNVSTVNIPANFAGLEAAQVPTRLMDQYFDIYEVTENEDYVEVKARHIFYRMIQNNTLWKPTEDTNYTGAAACRNVLTNAVFPSGFLVASDSTDTVAGKDLDYDRKNLVEAFLDPEKGICKKYDLNLIRDNDVFYCLKNVGYDRGMVIQNGKNLLGVERVESIENVATRVAPIGKNAKGEIVWLNNNGLKYIDSSHISDYPTPRLEIYDTGLQIGKDGVTGDNIQAKLLEAAQNRFSVDKVDLPEVTMTIEFLSLGDTEEYIQYRDLDKVYLYDIITIKDTIRGYNYSAQVIGVEHDILTGMLNSITIGSLQQADSSRKIAVWQVPEVDGTNIRLQSIMAGSFAPGAINSDDIANGAVQYVHFAAATIEYLVTDSLEAAAARIHDLIAGSITADDIVAGSLTSETIAAGAITTDLLAAGAVTAQTIASGAILAEKIASGAITEKLAAGAVSTDKLAAGSVTAATIAANAINADKIDANAASAIHAKIGTADVADARIAVADINFLHVKDLDAQSAYFGQAVIQEGIANKLFIPRLAVDYAQIVSATIGDLVIQATNENYYKLDVDLDGNVTATQITPSAQELEDGHTSDGRTIYTATDITASELNTTDIYASHALMDEITANIINVDKLFAREATISKINALDLSSNTYIASTIGNWQSGSTITQTIASISSRVAELGYGTIYYSTTEPSHTGLVEGDIWVQPLDDHTWEDYEQSTWQDILDEGTWGSVLGAYKVYTWTGQVWKTLFDSTVNTEMWTAIEQNTAAIALKASQTQVDLLSGEVSDFAATLEVQAQQISAAVSAVNAKTATYVSWNDPSLTHTIVLGDIWVKGQDNFGTWLQTSTTTWGYLKDHYKWKDALGHETYVWNGTAWIETSDRSVEVYAQTLIQQNANAISVLATANAVINDDIYRLRAEITITAGLIAQEVERATIAEGGKIDKTAQYQTAESIVTEAVSQAASEASGLFIAKTTTYQDAQSIVTEAVAQAASAAAGSYIAKTTTYQSADSIVQAAETWTAQQLANYSTLTQTSSAIEAYVGSHCYSTVSGISITASGVDVTGNMHINLDVNSSNYVHITSSGIAMMGSRVSVNGKDMWARDDIIVLKKTDNEATVIASMSGKHDWVLIKPYYDAQIGYVGTETIITESTNRMILPQTIGGLSFGDGASWYQYDLTIHMPTATGGGSSSVSFTIQLSENSDFSDSYSFSTGNMNVTSFPATISASSGHIAKNLCQKGGSLYVKVTEGVGATFTIDRIELSATCDSVTARVPCTTYYFP